jgi:hypothetical protein
MILNNLQNVTNVNKKLKNKIYQVIIINVLLKLKKIRIFLMQFKMVKKQNLVFKFQIETVLTNLIFYKINNKIEKKRKNQVYYHVKILIRINNIKVIDLAEIKIIINKINFLFKRHFLSII